MFAVTVTAVQPGGGGGIANFLGPSLGHSQVWEYVLLMSLQDHHHGVLSYTELDLPRHLVGCWYTSSGGMRSL